jgi:hypothetical protein
LFIFRESFDSPDVWFQVDGDFRVTKPMAIDVKPHSHSQSPTISSTPPLINDDDLSDYKKRKIDESDIVDESKIRKKLSINNDEIIIQDDDVVMTDEGAQKLIILD